jgi:hypothetical protein
MQGYAFGSTLTAGVVRDARVECQVWRGTARLGAPLPCRTSPSPVSASPMPSVFEPPNMTRSSTFFGISTGTSMNPWTMSPESYLGSSSATLRTAFSRTTRRMLRLRHRPQKGDRSNAAVHGAKMRSTLMSRTGCNFIPAHTAVMPAELIWTPLATTPTGYQLSASCSH